MKKKNPQDSTLRNVRAANRKIAELNRRVEALTEWVGEILSRTWQFVGKNALEEYSEDMANVSKKKQVRSKTSHH